MLVAQSLGEYGAHSANTSGLQQLADSIRTSVESASPTTWLIVGGVVLGALWLWSRRAAG